MQPSRPRPDLLIVLARTDEHGLAQLAGHICYRNDPTADGGSRDAEPGAVLTPSFEPPDGIHDRYADLYVRGSVDTGGVTDDGSCWGWGHEYRPRTVDLPRAQSMVAFLRRLERQLAALDTQFGAPATFADYVARFATALGISRYAVRSTKRLVDGTRWHWLDTDDMRRWVRHHEPPEPTPWP
ncbi:hypothetical protein GCM10009827_120280 [Dactylosporangium maewongense]|uniref:Uncharacterized protein n=1 Tax=Dactylosporangium maewongense TaxID=634393 RepID=A0ABN2DJJ5_9ACTN